MSGECKHQFIQGQLDLPEEGQLEPGVHEGYIRCADCGEVLEDTGFYAHWHVKEGFGIEASICSEPVP